MQPDAWGTNRGAIDSREYQQNFYILSEDEFKLESSMWIKLWSSLLWQQDIVMKFPDPTCKYTCKNTLWTLLTADSSSR